MAVAPRTRRFTVEEYHRMGEAGVLRPEDRVELIEGDVIEMPPIGNHHASVVDRLNALMVRRVGDRAIVRVQGPVRFPALYSEPQPDLLLLKPRADYYAETGPGAEDVLLLIEVMDTSVDYDRRRKTPLYARARVPEVWLVDLPASVVEVHRDPTDRGYREIRTIRRGDVLTPGAFPDITLGLADLLGPTS
jgi:Uma2 family endonuclease